MESETPTERPTEESPVGKTANNPSVPFELGKQVERTVTLSVGQGDERRQVEVPFLFYVPKSYGNGERPFPLMLFLHGYGESGDGDFDRIKIHGPPKLVDQKTDFGFIVVSPQVRRPEANQVRSAWQPDVLIALLDLVSKSVHVDPERTYVTGLSMGGFGTWRLIAAYPDRFAAAVAICGGGNPNAAEQIAKTPVWAFHGEDDAVVPLALSETMVDAIKAIGGDAKLTRYPETGHDSWTETYANEQVYQWLLSHRKKRDE